MISHPAHELYGVELSNIDVEKMGGDIVAKKPNAKLIRKENERISHYLLEDQYI